MGKEFAGPWLYKAKSGDIGVLRPWMDFGDLSEDEEKISKFQVRWLFLVLGGGSLRLLLSHPFSPSFYFFSPSPTPHPPSQTKIQEILMNNPGSTSFLLHRLMWVLSPVDIRELLDSMVEGGIVVEGKPGVFYLSVKAGER